MHADDLALAADAMAYYLLSLHARIAAMKSRARDRAESATLREKYRHYYEARERIRKGSSEPTKDVPAPYSF